MNALARLRLIACMIGFVLIGADANAQQRINKPFSLTAQSLGSQFDQRGTPAGTTGIYNTDGPGFGNVIPAPSSAGDWDDYDTTVAGDTAFITGFQFTGGVPASDDSMRFTWGVYLPPITTFASPTLTPLLSTSAPLGLYGVGNFGWTFTFTGVVSIPDTGLMGGLAYFQIDGPTAADDVVWIRTGTGALSVGNNDFCVGSSNDGCTKIQRFAFFAPDPATLGLLSIGALLTTRRKR